MSKAAELTREELVERLARRLYAEDAGYRGADIDWSGFEWTPHSKRIFFSEAEAIFAELKALGLVLVPVEPTDEMMAIEKAGVVLPGKTEMEHRIAQIRTDWLAMLTASPFAGN